MFYPGGVSKGFRHVPSRRCALPARHGSGYAQGSTERLGYLLIADLYAHLEALRCLQEERAAFLNGNLEAARKLGCSRETLSKRIAALEHACLRALGCPPARHAYAQVPETLRQTHGQDGRTFEVLWLGICLLKERIRWMAAGNVALLSRPAGGNGAGLTGDKKDDP